MRTELLRNRDKRIFYNIDDKGEPTEETLPCAMCGDIAFFIARETNEPLCIECYGNNSEARVKK